MTGEMGGTETSVNRGSVKCMLHKPKDLSSNLQSPCKKLGSVSYTCNLGAGKEEAGESLELTA